MGDAKVCDVYAMGEMTMVMHTWYFVYVRLGVPGI